MITAQINDISRDRYGYSATELDSLAALWLAEHIFAETGKNVYRRIANMRRRVGKSTDFPTYGSLFFETI